MESKQPKAASPRIQPRLIIHGGAGNITPATLPPDRYREYRESLLTIASSPVPPPPPPPKRPAPQTHTSTA